MTAKPHIFLDFDNSKFDTNMLILNYINERYGIPSIPDDYINNPSYELILQKYLPPDLIPHKDTIYEDFSKDILQSIEKHDAVAPMEGMVETIFKLSEKFTLWVVTARQRTGLHVIRHMLDKHVPDCIHDIHCVWGQYDNGEYYGVPKRDFIESIEGEKIAFLDDSAKEILEMQDLIPSYLYDPKGVNDSVKNINHRVRSWKEFGALAMTRI